MPQVTSLNTANHQKDDRQPPQIIPHTWKRNLRRQAGQ